MGEGLLSGGIAGIERLGASLRMAGVALSDIAARVGTPTFVYNAESIRERYRLLEDGFHDVPHRIHYAVKANGNLAVLRVAAELGAGADLVSGGELRRALAAGFPPERLIFSGVGKTEDELRLAIETGIGHIAIESIGELHLIASLADRLDRRVRLGIRINPEVTTETHPYIATGERGIKFGVPVDLVPDAAAFILAHGRLELTTVAMHLGSQLTDTEPYLHGLRHLLELVEALEAQGTTTITAVDIGGGLGVDYGGGRAMDVASFTTAVSRLMAGSHLLLYLEPGRFLVGNAGVLLTRVLYTKHAGGKEFVIVDAGFNDFLRPSLYQAHHALVPVVAAGRDERVVDVVGPICETGDFFALDRSLPEVEPGELVAVLGGGAYGFVMSSNYNTRPRAAEVLVDGGRFGVARPREREEDLFATENPTPLE